MGSCMKKNLSKIGNFFFCGPSDDIDTQIEPLVKSGQDPLSDYDGHKPVYASLLIKINVSPWILYTVRPPAKLKLWLKFVSKAPIPKVRT